MLPKWGLLVWSLRELEITDKAEERLKLPEQSKNTNLQTGYKYVQADSPWGNSSGSTTHCWIVPLGTPGVDWVTTIAVFLHVIQSYTC